MKRVVTGLALVLILVTSSCCLFQGGNVEKSTVSTLENHLKNIEKDHMKRLKDAPAADKSDVEKAWKAAYDAVEALKKQAK